ncbi:hypothetical protein [Halomonas campaniensis]|uniref:hypothetical protein n=1 Tax=Halomonas campaniensis TaxID=213554 RepID=UPI00197AE036|nr:hypothetical protein [Halomonas campaniensis]
MATRYRTCPHCGGQFSYKVSRGKDRKYCSDACQVSSNQMHAKDRRNDLPLCSVAGCECHANRVGAGLCEKHYMRMRRNGQIEKKNVVIPGNLVHSHGYMLTYSPGHPLQRGRHPRIYEHREVFYKVHGEGPFSCYWCREIVTWDDMHVDHLNDVRDDNSAKNLVASCAFCNQKRGHEKMKQTKRLQSSRRYTAHGKTMCLSEWARTLGISVASIEYRMNAGWAHNDVFSPRKGNTGPKSKPVEQEG